MSVRILQTRGEKITTLGLSNIRASPTFVLSITTFKSDFHTLLSGHEEFNDGLCP